jgi:hypothetical protein
MVGPDIGFSHEMMEKIALRMLIDALEGVRDAARIVALRQRGLDRKSVV